MTEFTGVLRGQSPRVDLRSDLRSSTIRSVKSPITLIAEHLGTSESLIEALSKPMSTNENDALKAMAALRAMLIRGGVLAVRSQDLDAIACLIGDLVLSGVPLQSPTVETAKGLHAEFSPAIRERNFGMLT